MKLKLALTVLLITHTLAENDEAKDVSEVEVKSAKTEDDAKSEDETSRNAESYTVPVEVVKDAITESEVVKKAEIDEHSQDSRVERSTASDIGLKSDENDNYFSETEHIAIRRSNEEPSKAVDDDDKSVKSAESSSDDVQEKAATPEAEVEKDDVSKNAKEEEQKDDLQVRSADDAEAKEKSAAQDESTLVSEVDALEKVAEIDDVSSLMAEGFEDLKTNLNTRRMSNPIETLLETKARLGDIVGVSDEGSVKFGDDDASKPADMLRSFDSPRPVATQPPIPPLMPLLSKHNFFLTPTLPLLPPYTSTQSPLRVPNLFPNSPPLQMNFLQPSELKPYNGLNSFPFQHPHLFPHLPLTTLRPLPPLPLANYPNFEELFRKPADNAKSQENIQQFPNNMGFNRRLQVAYGVPSYLRYSV